MSSCCDRRLSGRSGANLDALLTARKLLEEKPVAIQNHIRGLPCDFGLRVGFFRVKARGHHVSEVERPPGFPLDAASQPGDMPRAAGKKEFDEIRPGG